MTQRRLVQGAGVILILAGVVILAPWDFDTLQNASVPAGENATVAEPNYLGWGTLLLGFLTLASGSYFKLDDKRRADRAEAREIAERRRRMEDIN
jgi:hypothetical protein